MRTKKLQIQPRLLLLRQRRRRFAGHALHDLRKSRDRSQDRKLAGVLQARQLRRHGGQLQRALPVQPRDQVHRQRHHGLDGRQRLGGMPDVHQEITHDGKSVFTEML